jgi:eukaryotic-like serine/threonine-protein kinase
VIGTTLDGKYQIQRLLGAGAMGQVYAAEHAATGRRVAVKVISSPSLIGDATVIGRFQREARVAGSIDTQHITQVLDAGVDRDSGLPFLVMEFLAGEDLQHVIKRLGPLSADLALRITAQACLGLQKAHEGGVVHRDIKPANLYLAKRDAGEIIVKLLDFGIAKVKMDQAQDAENAGLTRTGSMIGSPLYMSPEQARGDARGIDARTDLWSLGIVLYEMLAGSTPYQHITALGQLILAICHEWPRHIQEAAPWVPPEVAAIVHRCLRHRAADRFQSAGEMFQAIRALLPGGWAIHEDMLVTLHESQRVQVANRLALSVPGGVPVTQSYPGYPPMDPRASLGSSPMLGASMPYGPPVHVGAATTDALAKSRAGSSGNGGKVALSVGAAIAVLGIGGGVTYVAMSSRAHAHVTDAAPARPADGVPPAGSVVAAPVSAPVVTAAAPAPTAVDTTARRVKVVIMPPDASVEVEGEPGVAKNGLLEITGTLGSVFRVRVFKGKHETTTDVIITQEGPSPPKIELSLLGPAKPGPGSPSGAPSAAAPPAPTAKPGIVGQFE